MSRLLGPGLLAALAAATLLAWSAPEALGNHVQCGDVITQDTTLDSDLVDCPEDGIVIGADGITLDLGGHTVDGDGVPTEHPLGCEAGIANGPWSYCPRPGEAGHDDVTIRNGTVREFYYGVHIWGTDRNLVRGLTASGNAGGIALVESHNAVIERNDLSGNPDYAGTGIFLSEASNNRVERNDLSRNAYGIHAYDGIVGNTFEKNIFFENSAAGMHLHSARNNVVANNWAIDNGGQGIELSDGASDNLVRGNRTSGNGSAGILIWDGVHRNRVERNRVFDNAPGVVDSTSGGIVVWGDAWVTHNVVYRNGRGIVVCCLSGVVVERNRVFGNELGIAIEHSDDNLVARNLVVGNSTGGIALTSHEHVSSDGNVIERNDVNRNGGDGILVAERQSGSAGSLISDNITNRNADDGIDIDEPLTTVLRNTAARNGDLGIEAVAGTTDGGGNRAFRNGNPLQCLNVVCR